MQLSNNSQKKIVSYLNRILQHELAGVIRYTHHSFMVFGFNRIPIVKWLREQAQESMLHAQKAGEMITILGEAPSLSIGKLLSKTTRDLRSILKDSLAYEQEAQQLYEAFLGIVEGQSIMLEEYARAMAAEEQMHVGEVMKMLSKPE
ncbi:MAG: ferritin-like domain-containing protein [Chlamydiota bacterium]|nr:ferritin-like domain-containing protein [Chlamydiota bacterium]